jgi:hypothetical protein
MLEIFLLNYIIIFGMHTIMTNKFLFPLLLFLYKKLVYDMVLVTIAVKYYRNCIFFVPGK